MSKPALNKRLSKYKIKKCLIDCSFLGKKEIEEILKKRQYVQHTEYWINGFVKVYILNTSALISIDHPINKSNGVRFFFEKTIFIETLQYFENRLNK